MFIFRPHQNILESKSQCLVNPVNTIGVMGKGLAKQFKDKYPDMFKQYKSKCLTHKLEIGLLDIYIVPDAKQMIINLPTKKHWQDPSKFDYIEAGLNTLYIYLTNNPNIKSIAIPKIGCGCGQLSWIVILPLIKKILYPLSTNIDIEIYGEDFI